MAELKKKVEKQNHKKKDKTEAIPGRIDIAENIAEWTKNQAKMNATKQN